MDLSSDYLGFRLESPLMVGASPIVDDLEAVLRCADAGASAIVMHSLYEEQLTAQQMAYVQDVDSHGDSFAEALSIRPTTPRLEYALGPSEYLEQLRRIKARVSVPVSGSLNGPKPTSSSTKKITFGAPSGARAGAGQAGLDSSTVRPITGG